MINREAIIIKPTVEQLNHDFDSVKAQAIVKYETMLKEKCLNAIDYKPRTEWFYDGDDFVQNRVTFRITAIHKLYI